MKHAKSRVIIFAIILILSIIVVEAKKAKVAAERERPTESVLSLVLEKGIPIHTIKVTKGDFETTKLATLQPCGDYQLCTYLSRKELLPIKVGQLVTSAKTEHKIGKVSFVSRTQDFKNGLYKVVVTSNVSVAKIKKEIEKRAKGPGMYFVSSIVTGVYKNVIKLPVAALVREGDSVYVWKVLSETEVKKVEVKVGKANTQYQHILEGLTEGDQVVVRGQSLLPKYDRFRVVKTL